MAFSRPSFPLPSLWREYLCTLKASKVLFKQGNVLIKNQHKNPPSQGYRRHLTSWCAPGVENLKSLIVIGIWHHMGGLGENLNKLPQNCCEAIRHRKTTPFFEMFWPKKKGLQSFVLCLKVNTCKIFCLEKFNHFYVFIMYINKKQLLLGHSGSSKQVVKGEFLFSLPLLILAMYIQGTGAFDHLSWGIWNQFGPGDGNLTNQKFKIATCTCTPVIGIGMDFPIYHYSLLYFL